MRHAATVFSKAAAELIEKGRAIAAAVLGTPADRIAFTDGRFVSRDTNRYFDLFEVAAEAAPLASDAAAHEANIATPASIRQ